jgi:uncharacterized membrane protein YgcG
MKKIYLILFTICILIFPTNIIANEQRVFDFAELLSDDEIQKLEQQIAEIQDLYNIDIVLMTTYYSGEKPVQQFAVDLYNEYFFEDGMLLLIDMNERYIYQTYTGRMITNFTEERKIAIEDVIFEYAGNENYSGLFDAYIREVKGYLDFDHRSFTQKVLDSDVILVSFLIAVSASYYMMRSKTKNGRLYENRDKHKRELNQKLVYDIDQAELFDSKTTRAYIKSKNHSKNSLFSNDIDTELELLKHSASSSKKPKMHKSSSKSTSYKNNYTGSTTNRSSSGKTTTNNSSSSDKTHSGRGRNF